MEARSSVRDAADASGGDDTVVARNEIGARPEACGGVGW